MKLLIILTSFISLNFAIFGKEFKATNTADIISSVNSLKAGDQLIISAGEFSGGISLKNLKGSKSKPIIISGASTQETIFKNGRQAFHLVNCHYIILKNFTVKNFSINGINADDGGSQEKPSSGLVFENLSIIEIGPKGNLDGLKLSGLHNFTVKNCYFAGWGGSAVDMVGCHNGIIRDCTLKGIDGYSQDTGIQIKGGSSKIRVFKNSFTRAGQRAINLGGSTGIKWFRPLGAKYEAKDIEIAGNTFIGGMAHIAFVTSQNSHIHHNHFHKPDKWFFRLLQETKDPSFIKSQGGKVEKNVFIFDQKVRTFINIGSGTSPQTFAFNENLWQDTQGDRKANLPVKESKGIYNIGLKIFQYKNGTYQVESKYRKLGPFSYEIDK